MMQSIRTRYLAVTNHRPNRVKAMAAPKSITRTWGDRHGSDQNHAVAAAQELAQALGWAGVWVGGCFDGLEAREWVWIGKVVPDSFTPPGSHGRLVQGKDWFLVV